MTLNEHHAWRKDTLAEVEFVQETSALRKGASVLDVGCGDGRHALAFAARGFQVVGVDISQNLIEQAREQADGTTTTFSVGDARLVDELPQGPFDVALCLYDVLGSSANSEDDLKLLLNVRNRLRPGGHIFVSVMNNRITFPHLTPNHKPLSIEEFVRSLESLSPSSTMEQTGNIGTCQ